MRAELTRKKKMMIVVIISMFIICLITAGYIVEHNRSNVQEDTELKSQVITAEQAKEIMDNTEDYMILDVREADEYAEGHIEGAIRLSYTEIEEKAESILEDKNQLILVYCRSGRRSAIAAEALVKLGYSNVKDFGGIIDWPYEVVK